MSYKPGLPPESYDAKWMQDELAKLQQALNTPHELVEYNVVPVRPRDGLTVLADGTNWNPGSGQGAYTYYAGAWHKLG